MSVDNATFMIAIGFFFIYFILYKTNRLMGNIGYLGLGLGTYMSQSSNTGKMIGLIIFVGSIIKLIYDLLKPKKKK